MLEAVNIVAKVVLCDIEGTTTSISFVKDVLFPYAKDNMKSFLTEKWEDSNVNSFINELKVIPQFAEFRENTESDDITVDLICDFINFLTDKDLKLLPLKCLQGLVWERGYDIGTIKGHVYDDVPLAFKKWTEAGHNIYIYSSGSVQAQKMLFENSIHGNLLRYISDHFDTKIGHKQQPQSYKNIVERLNVPSNEILFLTDIVEEATAAIKSGMQAIILDRPGNKKLTDENKMNFKIVQNLFGFDLSLQ